MKSSLCRLLTWIAVALPLFSQPPAAQRRALVIANFSYQYLPPLRTPQANAGTLAPVLAKAGFLTEEANDLTQEELVETIGVFTRTIQHGDAVLIYYSGYTYQSGGLNRLVPVDYDPSDKKVLAMKTYSLDEVQRQLEDRRAGVRMLFLDGSRSAQSLSFGLAPAAALKNGVILSSAAPNRFASDPADGGVDTFTAALVSGIGTPGATLQSVLATVQAAVKRADPNGIAPALTQDQQLEEFLFLSTPPLPPAVSFRAEPQAIRSGESATLQWEVTGDISGVSIDRGIGRIPASGTRSLAPSASTVYTMTAFGPGGTVSAQASVNVTTPPPPCPICPPIPPPAPPDDPDVVTAALQLRAGKPKPALDSLNRAIERLEKSAPADPRLEYALRLRGIAKEQAGDSGAAFPDLIRATRLRPDPESYYHLAIFWQKRSDWQNAIENYTLAIDAGLTSLDVFRARGLLYVQTGKLKEAIADFTKAIELSPEDEDSLKERAKAERQIGDLSAAGADDNALAGIASVRRIFSTATAVSLQFYGWDGVSPMDGQPPFQTVFAGESTRRVGRAFVLKLGDTTRTPVDFTVSEIWYAPDGTIGYQGSARMHLDTGQGFWTHSDWRLKSGEPLLAGKYSVELRVLEFTVAKGDFEVK